jgi:hypothetical protein
METAMLRHSGPPIAARKHRPGQSGKTNLANAQADARTVRYSPTRRKGAAHLVTRKQGAWVQVPGRNESPSLMPETSTGRQSQEPAARGLFHFRSRSPGIDPSSGSAPRKATRPHRRIEAPRTTSEHRAVCPALFTPASATASKRAAGVNAALLLSARTPRKLARERTAAPQPHPAVSRNARTHNP